MGRVRIVYFLSIALLIVGGILFARINRYDKMVAVSEELKDKTITFYSSNYKRQYINSSRGSVGDLERLCVEGADNLKRSDINAADFQITEGPMDPYNQSAVYLDRNLKKDTEYILIDVSRGQSKYGSKYKAGEDFCCPISIILSNKSKSYNNSLLFAGRIKAVLDKKYDELPVRIIELSDIDYNQSKGYIGMLVEFGDASNSYGEAAKSMKIFCEAIKEVMGVAR